MKEYAIYSSNLNDSLAFYRTLFDRMPVELNTQRLVFVVEDFRLEISEAAGNEAHMLTYPMLDKTQLISVHERMKRFRSVERFRSDCQELNQSFGLKDPDGNRWKVGDPSAVIHFDQCYFN